MAEFCKKCFVEIFGPVQENETIITTDSLELCEGCGKWEPVVIEIKPLNT